MTEIELARQAIRITGTALDTELSEEIETCKSMLRMGGVREGFTGSAMERAAIRTYVRWQHNYMGEAERWERNFGQLRDAMALCTEAETV